MAIRDKRLLERRFETALTDMSAALEHFGLMSRYRTEIRHIQALISNSTPSNYDIVAKKIEDFCERCTLALTEAEKNVPPPSNVYPFKSGTRRKRPR